MMKLANIQILRALAALAVVIYHVGIESTSVCKSAALPCAYNFIFGFNGVVLFFMISGFIMVVTSWENFGRQGATRKFLEKRLKRVVPLYWLITTLAVIGVYFVPAMLNVPVLEPSYVLGSYLFWPVERLNGLVRPIANLGWTLNLEMFFYAIFAVALFFCRLRGLVAAVVFLLALAALHTTGVFASGGSLASVPLHFWADPIIFNFVIGIGVGVLYMKGFRITKAESLMLLAIGLACAAALFYNEAFINSFPEDHIFPRFVAALPALPILMIGALGAQINVSKLWAKAGLLLGDASYSLYLIHPFILRPFRAVWSKFVGDALPVWSFMLASVALALLAGLACYFIAERTATNYFNRRTVKAKATDAKVAAQPTVS